VTQRLRRAVGLPDRDGVLVRVIEQNSPGERAGLRRGDLITAVGGNDVTDADDVAAALEALPDGASLPLHVVRGSDELDLVATFDDAPAGADEPGADGPADPGDA
jgi:S1-C subfamily serine protease